MVHFLAAGLVLLGVLSHQETRGDRVIRIPAAEVAQMADAFRGQNGQAPDARELQGLIDERVDEEVLAREARRMGLDADDVIIRRRLAQKMAFANEDLQRIAEPTDAELRAWYAAHRADFEAPETVSFRHLYFSRARRAPSADAQAALRVLKAGGRATGDPFMMPLEIAEARAPELRRDFGQAFADAVMAAPLRSWSGPVESALGVHLVRVESRSAGRPAAYEEVVPRVRDAVLAERRAAANARWRADLRKRYRIEVEPLGKAPEAPAGIE